MKVRVSGDLDLSTSPQLRDVLGRELDHGNLVVLDLSQVTFIDSTALNALVGAVRWCESNGGSFVVGPDLPAQVSRVFAVTGLDAILPIGSS